MIVQMYKYRLYPSGKQKIKLINSLKTCKTIYNELLALSIDSWKFGKVSLSGFDYKYYLAGEYSEIYSQVRDNVSDRVHKAFQNFFRRVKENAKEKGFPRFKSRVNSITYPQAIVKGKKRIYRNGFGFNSNKRLHVSKIGNIPIILHRVPKGKIKTLTIKVNNANQWFAVFACEMPDSKVIHSSKEKIGIDVGIENFATLSNGEVIANPRYLVNAEKRLKTLNRRLSRKVKGSKNRLKAIHRVAKQHLKVSNQRTDFLHKMSRMLINKFSTIYIEDLKVANMVKNHHLAKSISDAGWGSFFSMLSYKAVTSGGQVIERNPRRTSMTCNKCGAVMEMPLSKRTFTCLNCGFVCHRDENASLNILNGMGGLPKTLTPVETSPSATEQSAVSAVIESGTICNS